MYDEGEGVTEDNTEAVKWYRLAAEQGDADAQYNLGGIYVFGKGIRQDSVLAHMWYIIAAANGNENASKQIDDPPTFYATSAVISKAQKMARECMNTNYQNCDW